MFNLGMPELIFIFLIVLLIFGGKKLPEIARGLGKGIREFHKAKDGIIDALDEDDGKTAPVEAKSPVPSSPAAGNKK